MGHVASLWRHPIKSHGREQLEKVSLSAGQTMPWDRHWAVTHSASKFDTTKPEWLMCRNFMIGTGTPALAGIWARFDQINGAVTLTHADLSPITFRPDDPADVARFIVWITPLCPADKPQPAAIIKVPNRGMTDTDYPSISIMNFASHREVAAQMGDTLEVERWRGNIWVESIPAWDEFNWIGANLRIGKAILHVRERIRRCMHTSANPHTGKRDIDTLRALRDGWDHQDFGVYAEVIESGEIRNGDTIEVL